MLNHKPVFDGRLSVREIQRGWDLKAELVTLSACETALGRDAGGEGFVGFTQALLMSGTRSVCLSLWKVDDTATALLMQRFYANLLGRRPGLTAPMPKAEALREAKAWLRGLRRAGGAGPDRGACRAASSEAKVPRPASRPTSPPRSLPAGTTTGRTRPRTSGPRSCWPATRIEMRSSPGCPIELGVSNTWRIVVYIITARFLQFFCTYCPCQPNATTMRKTAGVIVNPRKIPEIYVNPTSAQCQADGRRAGLKIRSSQEGVGSSPTFGTIDLRRMLYFT